MGKKVHWLEEWKHNGERRVTPIHTPKSNDILLMTTDTQKVTCNTCRKGMAAMVLLKLVGEGRWYEYEPF